MGWPRDFQTRTLKVFLSAILLTQSYFSEGDIKHSAARLLIHLGELEGFLV